MPCTYYTPQEEQEMARAEARKYKQELDKATKLLCELMTNLTYPNGNIDPDEGPSGPVTQEHLKWWEKHQEMDRKRLEAEALEQARAAKIAKTDKLRKAAIAKLTKEEAAALGVRLPPESRPKRKK